MDRLESNPYHPCTQQTMTDAVSRLVGIEFDPHAQPFENRLAVFANQLKQWAEQEGNGAIQRSLAIECKRDRSDTWSMLLGLSNQTYPYVRVPLWVTMSVLMPYLKTDPQSVREPNMPFAVSTDAWLNPGKFLRNGVIQAVSAQKTPDSQPFLEWIVPLIGMMATLASQPNGHEALQSALFERNSEGKSVCHYLFMGRQGGYHLPNAFYIVGLLFAFKLDVQRFNRNHAYSLTHCLIALAALHSDHHIAPHELKKNERMYYYIVLNELLIWATPPCFSVATPEDGANESAGVLSAMSYEGNPEEWWCLSPPGNPISRIIEPRSWFLDFLKDTPYMPHPYTREVIEWGGEDLYRLGILSGFDETCAVLLVRRVDDHDEEGNLTVQYDRYNRSDETVRELDVCLSESDLLVVSAVQIWGRGALRQTHHTGGLSWIEAGCHFRFFASKSYFKLVYPFEIIKTDDTVTIDKPGSSKVFHRPTPAAVMAYMLASVEGVPSPLFPEHPVACTVATMIQAITQLLGLDEAHTSLLPFKDRLEMFTTQLKKWSETVGDGIIQKVLVAKSTTDSRMPLNALIRFHPYKRLAVNVPFWMVMDPLIPYLTRESDTVIKGVLFKSPFHFPANYLTNPGQAIRRLIVSYVSSDTTSNTQSLFQLMGLLATLSSQPNGCVTIQDALFEKNKDGKSAFYYLFVGHNRGYDPTRAIFLMGLLLAFKLDVKRFDRTYSYSFLHCVMMRMALSDSTLSHEEGIGDRPPLSHMYALNTLCLNLMPSHFTLATQADLSGASAGVLSGISPLDPQEEWLCFSTADDPNPIIEPRSWFQQKAKTDPFTHPRTMQPIQWGGDDLFWLGMQSAVGHQGIEGIPLDASFPTQDSVPIGGIVRERHADGGVTLTQVGCVVPVANRPGSPTPFGVTVVPSRHQIVTKGPDGARCWSTDPIRFFEQVLAGLGSAVTR
ncbi:hypothetical protein EBZ35_04660 [bacterium]|nr:hypothetical protein [bacterium]